MQLQGVVTQFAGNGRKLGYPTANLRIETDYADGVYFGFADLAEYSQQPAIIFVGTPTTLGDSERRVEVHLLDIPDQDYYQQQLSARLEKYHRPNQTFESIEKLVAVMKNDEQVARQWFTSISSGSARP